MTPTLSLIGYGNMGKEVHSLALEKGFDIRSIIDASAQPSARSAVYPEVGTNSAGCIDPESLNGADVAIEFTAPGSVVNNIQAMAKAGIHMVVGTTGWEEHRGKMRSLVESTGTALIYANNFSIGIHLFRKLAAMAASLLNSYSQYDIALHELHHKRKKDAPSGTALLLAEDIIHNLERKATIVTEHPDEVAHEKHLLISSSRVGAVPGTHSVVIDGPTDSLELVHRARNRTGFAEGALLAAAWIANKKGFYSIEDMFDDIESL